MGVRAGTDYTVRMTGTPPKDMRFALRAGANLGDADGVKVTIPYPTTSALTVKAKLGEADAVKVDPNPFDDAAGMPTALEKQECGENRYVGVANLLEVYEGSVVARVLLLDEDEDGTAETTSTWSDK